MYILEKVGPKALVLTDLVHVGNKVRRSDCQVESRDDEKNKA